MVKCHQVSDEWCECKIIDCAFEKKMHVASVSPFQGNQEITTQVPQRIFSPRIASHFHVRQVGLFWLHPSYFSFISSLNTTRSPRFGCHTNTKKDNPATFCGVDFPGGSRWSSWLGGCSLFSPCSSNVNQGIALERMIKTSFTTFWGGFDLRCMVSWWCLHIYFIEVHKNSWISSYLSDTFHWNKWICWNYLHGHTYLCYPKAHKHDADHLFERKCIYKIIQILLSAILSKASQVSKRNTHASYPGQTIKTDGNFTRIHATNTNLLVWGHLFR